ncbi:hypothetical protein C0J56_04340 [Pseudomonas fluorescens]|nr:hypothetical protein C0J56_04340 [Pseudomonas fluorescens]
MRLYEFLQRLGARARILVVLKVKARRCTRTFKIVTLRVGPSLQKKLNFLLNFMMAMSIEGIAYNESRQAWRSAATLS